MTVEQAELAEWKEIWAEIELELSGRREAPMAGHRGNKPRAFAELEVGCAAIAGDERPPLEAFERVTLFDLSGGIAGFSSTTRRKLRDRLVLRLPIDGEFKLLVVEVVRCLGVMAESGEVSFQIGGRLLAVLES